MRQDHPSSLSDLGRRSRHKTDMVLGRWGLGQIADASPGLAALARAFAATREATCFDLESEVDLRRLANPEMVLGACRGLVVLDEIQRAPHLFNVLRVLVDRPGVDVQFLILGSASPDLVRGVSESLAGRVEFIELTGFGLGETDVQDWRRLWVRGGLPRSYLAASDHDSMVLARRVRADIP